MIVLQFTCCCSVCNCNSSICSTVWKCFDLHRSMSSQFDAAEKHESAEQTSCLKFHMALLSNRCAAATTAVCLHPLEALYLARLVHIQGIVLHWRGHSHPCFYDLKAKALSASQTDIHKVLVGSKAQSATSCHSFAGICRQICMSLLVSLLLLKPPYV